MASKIKYDSNVDYQSLINDAISKGDTTAANTYNTQRNAKIADMNAAGSNKYSYAANTNPTSNVKYDTSSVSKPATNEHYNYINSNFAGGIDAYKQMQQNKYNNAILNGDADMLSRLGADMNRVGYTLDTSQKATQAPTLELPTLELPSYKKFSYDDFNYDDFNYDVNNDSSYKQYADMYARQGQSAGEQALANTAAATGGMPSSYAAAANAQTQQAYAKKTADMIPTLEENAYNKYTNERNFDYSDYINDRNLDYSEHQNKYNSDVNNANAEYNANAANAKDSYSANWDTVNYNTSKANTSYDREKTEAATEYQKVLDSIDNKYRQDTFNWNKSTDARDYAHNASQDAVQNSLAKDDNSRAWAQYNYNKTQDAISNNLNQAKFNYQKEQDSKAAAAKAGTTVDENVVQSAISDAMQSEDSAAWLRENASYLTDGEYNRVIKVLKDYGALSK